MVAIPAAVAALVLLLVAVEAGMRASREDRPPETTLEFGGNKQEGRPNGFRWCATRTPLERLFGMERCEALSASAPGFPDEPVRGEAGTEMVFRFGGYEPTAFGAQVWPDGAEIAARVSGDRMEAVAGMPPGAHKVSVRADFPQGYVSAGFHVTIEGER